MKVSIVTPVGNEERTLPIFLRRINMMLSSHLAPYDVVCHMITDTGGRDASALYLETFKKDYPWLRHSHIETVGLAGAYMHGYKLALESGSDYIIEFDVGHPERILPTIAFLLYSYDAVFCTRFHERGDYLGSWERRWISRFSTIAFNLWLGTKLSDATGGLQGFRREVLADVDFDKFISRGHDFQSELKYVVTLKTDKIYELPFAYTASVSSFRPKELIAAAKTLLNLRKVHGRK